MTTDTIDFHIEGKLLPDRIADTLRQAILTGQLAPGERLIEAELAEKLQVSRAPLREALRQLEADGLLSNQPRKGTFVVELELTDIWEIYTLRLALETLAVEILVEKITAEQVEALYETVAEMEKLEVGTDLWTLVDFEMKFHEQICFYSNHSRLYKVWMQMGNQLRTFFAAADIFFEPGIYVTRHRELVESITSGDKEVATAMLREHILNAAKLVTGKA